MTTTPGTPDPRSGDRTPPTRRRFLSGAAVLGATAAASGLTGAAIAEAQPAPVSDAERARFAGRVVLITGATSGIGEGTARAFAARGARVFFCGRREELGRQVQDSIRAAGGDATYQRADVREEPQVQAFVQGCLDRYGRIDIAFNNAGISTDPATPLADLSLEAFTDVMRTNAFGVFLSQKYEIPHLLRNEPWGAFGTRGVIVNTASVSGFTAYPNISSYSTSKHAIVALTKAAALDYRHQGIRVNGIAPGGVDTPMRTRAYAGRIPPGQPLPPPPNVDQRVNTVAEMADVVMYLSSDAASSISGTVLDVTSGQLTGYVPAT